MQGKIIRGIAGFYYVHGRNGKVYECKAKGIFRNQKIKPLVGDNVEMEVLDEKAAVGNVVRILRRSNQLIRPAVANVDQALVFFAFREPAPNLNLLNRFLVMMERQGVSCRICFNKKDLANEREEKLLRGRFAGTGYPVYTLSTRTGEGVEELRAVLAAKTTVLAGPSGVGKSSFLNALIPGAGMETGAVSEKIGRGRHTTRHSEMFALAEEGFILDTPGFTSLWLETEAEALKEYFPEFEPYWRDCRFPGCLHVNEPGCRVKQALAEGKISPVRYETYVGLYEELRTRKKY